MPADQQRKPDQNRASRAAEAWLGSTGPRKAGGPVAILTRRAQQGPMHPLLAASMIGLLLSPRLVAQEAAAHSRMTAAEVKAKLAVATEQNPPDLTGADLSGLELDGVDFRRAKLSRVHLVKARLAKANLFTCDLTDAVLTGADLREANLDGTVLRRANLHEADLEGASLFATIIERADLSGANLRKARIIGYLKGANLAKAVLREANIGADPGNQSMGVMRATFVGADLSGADLSSANLYKADFSFASLTGARLAGADLRTTDLVQTDFSGADITGANFAKADINGAIFRGVVGRAQAKGFDQARNRDKAIFDAH